MQAACHVLHGEVLIASGFWWSPAVDLCCRISTFTWQWGIDILMHSPIVFVIDVIWSGTCAPQQPNLIVDVDGVMDAVLQACPHGSVDFRLRPPGMDLWTSHTPSAAELALQFMLLGAGVDLQYMLLKGTPPPSFPGWLFVSSHFSPHRPVLSV